MSFRPGGHFLPALVGNRVAERIDADSPVLRVRGAGQQVHGLHHMGVAAYNHIDAQIAHLLGNGTLVGILCQQILGAPMDVQHNGLRPILPQIGKVGLNLRIELLQLVHRKVIDHAGFPDDRLFLEIQIGSAVTFQSGGIGIAEHADFDAVHVHNGVFLLIVIQLGAKRSQAPAANLLQGALQALHSGIGTVVIGRQQHIKARVCQSICQRVGAVEVGIALIRIPIAAEGRLQVGHRVIRPGNGILHIPENRIEIILPIPQVAGAGIFGIGGKQVLMHQHIPHGGHRRPGGYGQARLRLLRGHRGFRFAGGGLSIVLFAAHGQHQRHNQKQDCCGNQQHQRLHTAASFSSAPLRRLTRPCPIAGRLKFSCHLVTPLLRPRFWGVFTDLLPFYHRI